MAGFQLPDCSKLVLNRKNGDGVTFFRLDVIVKFFKRRFVCLVNFSYWSKFHVSIITDSGVMTISIYKGLTRNPEIGNTPVLLNIWRLGRVRDTKFGTNVSSKMLLNTAKCQGYRHLRAYLKSVQNSCGRSLSRKWCPTISERNLC